MQASPALLSEIEVNGVGGLAPECFAPNEVLQAARSRALVLVLLGVAWIQYCCYQGMTNGGGTAVAAIVTCLLLLCAGIDALVVYRRHHLKVYSRTSLIVLLGILVLGYTQAHRHFASRHQVEYAKQYIDEKNPRKLCTTIWQIDPPGRNAAYRFIATLDSDTDIPLRVAVEASPLQFRITPRVGDRVCAEFQLRPIAKGGVYPNVGEKGSWLIRRGVALRARLRSAVSHSVNSYSARAHLSGWVTPRRFELLERFSHFESIGVLYGAVLGRKDLIGEQTVTVFRSLGVSHLLVISGFHIAIVLISIRALLRAVLGRYSYCYTFTPLSVLATRVAIGTTWLYYMLLPSSLPAVRALCSASMILLTLGGLRKVNFFRGLACVALILHVLHPLAGVEVGVQLTFSALFGLWLGRRISRVRGSCTMVSAWYLSVGAWCCTAPFIALHFSQILTLGAFWSWILCPTFSLIVLYPGMVLVALELLFASLPSGLWECYFRVCDSLLDVMSYADALTTRLHLGPIVLEENQRWIVAIPTLLIVCVLSVGTCERAQRNISSPFV